MSDTGDKYAIPDAPSVGSEENVNPKAFSPGKAVYQTIAPAGALTKDQVFATQTPVEEIPPEAIAAYNRYLQLKDSTDQQSADTARQGRKEAFRLINGTKFTEQDLKRLGSASKKDAVNKALEAQGRALVFRSKITDSGLVERMVMVNQAMQDKVERLEAEARSLSIAAGISPTSVSAPPPISASNSKFRNKFSKFGRAKNAQDQIGKELFSQPQITAPRVLSNNSIQPTGGSGVYTYQPLDLYDDRYDFETGKKISIGVVGGAAGGAGDTTTKGNTFDTVEQSESTNSGPVKC